MEVSFRNIIAVLIFGFLIGFFVSQELYCSVPSDLNIEKIGFLK